MSTIKNSSTWVNPEVRDCIRAVVRWLIYGVVVCIPMMGRLIFWASNCNLLAKLVVIKLACEYESSRTRQGMGRPVLSRMSIFAVASNTRVSKSTFRQVIWTCGDV